MVFIVYISRTPTYSLYSAPETVLSASQALILRAGLWGEYYYHPYLQLGTQSGQAAELEFTSGCLTPKAVPPWLPCCSLCSLWKSDFSWLHNIPVGSPVIGTMPHLRPQSPFQPRSFRLSEFVDYRKRILTIVCCNCCLQAMYSEAGETLLKKHLL